MKIEILFRGKRVIDGKWIFGMPTYDFKYIFNDENLDSPDNFEVIPETVGQLRHKNKYGRYFDGDVYYHAGFGLCEVSDVCELQIALATGNSDDIVEIQGNIHDNPELYEHDPVRTQRLSVRLLNPTRI